MGSKVGLRIRETIDRPAKELVEAFRGIPTSNINDTMNRLFCMASYISPMNHVDSMVGTAITVKAATGDNLFFHRALDIAQPGDIIVVDGGGATERSVAGEMMMIYAEKKGIAGVVVDGAMRDLDGIQKLKMPVYTKAINPQGPYKNGPGEINFPVSCGNQVVRPGDIIVGDQDGIVVIRPEDAEEVLALAKEKFDEETRKIEKFEQCGANVEEHSSKFASAMEKKGVQYV